MPTPLIRTSTENLVAEARRTIEKTPYWVPEVRRRFLAIVAELYGRGVVSGFDCGTTAGYLHHGDRDEEPCELCQLRADVRRRRADAAAVRKAEGRRSDRLRERDENFRDLHEHWQDVLDCEAQGVRHTCWSCR